MTEPHEDFKTTGAARYYNRLTQGSAEWQELRLGLITASEMFKILTPTLKIANNKDTRTQIFELAGQRITKFVEPHFVSFDMERGKLEETDARIEYEKHYSKVDQCGFIINNALGFDVGFSPDGLVGDDGFIEIKSRKAKFQIQTIMEHLAESNPDTPIPSEFMLQCQTGLFVTGRKWCDFVSYSNGLNMVTIRTYPIIEYQEVISAAIVVAETKIQDMISKYSETIAAQSNSIHAVERSDYSEEISL